MKALVKDFLNVRTVQPVLNVNNNPGFLKPGTPVEIDQIVIGQEIEGNRLWLQLKDGSFVWSGGANVDWSSYNNNNSTLFNKNGLARLWHFGRGENVKVAVIDSFIDLNLDAFKSTKISVLNELDSGVRRKEHGSYMSSIIGAANFLDGFVGVAPNCQILFYQIKEDPTCKDIINALELAKEAQVFNLSFGTTKISENDPQFNDLKKLITAYRTRDKIIVASTGQLQSINSPVFFPASYTEVISIGGMISNDLWSESHYWNGMSAIAPIGKYFTEFRPIFSEVGTSNASALVSGVVAAIYNQLRQKKGSKTVADFFLTLLPNISLSTEIGNITTRQFNIDHLIRHL